MGNQPTLSVVMPNYNHARFLPEALQAILDQSYQPTEIIIIDDASTDNSIEVLEQFAQKYPVIRLVRNEQNRGVIYNANRLLEMASGDYVYGAAADDKVLPGLLEKSMKLLTQYPEAGLCSTQSLLINETGQNTGLDKSLIISSRPIFLTPDKVLKTLSQDGSWIIGNTTIYRRQAFLDAGGFIPGLHAFCDGFIQQVIALRHGACFIPEPLAAWRRMETGYSASMSTNIERRLEVMEQASQLMRTTYRDLFPEDYVKEWERKWLYFAGKNAWASVSQKQQRFLRQDFTLLCPTPSWLDKLFQFFLRMSIYFQKVIIEIYWFAKFRSLPKWLLYRYRQFKEK